MNDTAPPDKLHRALADPHRARIVDELRRTPRGLDTQALARRLALHPNTVRWHLGILADAAIVSSRPEGRATPGRPRIVYKLSDRTEAGDEGSYRLLATILSGALSALADGAARAERIGRAWGRYLVKRPPPGTHVPDEDATQEVVELLAGQGFRPEVAGDEIHMHHCPYRELAPGIVCSVHLGVVRGALDELGGNLDVTRLEPLVEPELCIARLEPRRDERHAE